ncbi:energy transducer TonB [Pyxidicoccus parkwayensis]|uniref:Energy transducer TonB n=1 Tax=Pyxidicoccus parkwayensis TaxID=2813578 RepID=A0ABX7PA64_9BACT|nr:energy transducer TonB [Pyxidicoccus parkwaysis]QSQ27313.1 energy transducer TonB [Pyxidicoccus parkwaysis]
MSTGSSPTDWRRRKRQGSPWRVVAAVALALLLHAVYVGAVLLSGSLASASREKQPHKPTSVVVRPLTADQWAKNRGQVDPRSKQQVSERPRSKEKKEEEKKPEEKPKGQVVDVAPGNNEVDPNAKYLAESDNRTKKETRSREQTPFYRNAMPQRTAPQAQEGANANQDQAPRTAGNNGAGNDEKPMAEAQRKPSFEIPDARKKNEVAVKTDPNTRGPGLTVNQQNESDELTGNSKRLKIQPGVGGEEEGSAGRMGSPGMAALQPSRAAMDKVVGAAPNDHLDADEGDETLLNTREWKYASFFNRVKQSVGMHWNPNEQLRRRDPTGATYSGKDRYTLLTITLDEKGQLKDVQVDKSSGLDFLDLEAVSSFKRAQPFPNPPPGLLSQDSEVKFQFGFFMEMGGGPRMRLFRQPN